MEAYSADANQNEANGIDETVVTKEQLASVIVSLSSSVREFVNAANAIIEIYAKERKANEDAISE